MTEKKFYEIHRSDAIYLLLEKEKNPTQYTNLRLAELLEEYFPEKSKMREYIVKEDDLPLDNKLTIKTF
jgi:hypothetical protein